MNSAIKKGCLHRNAAILQFLFHVLLRRNAEIANGRLAMMAIIGSSEQRDRQVIGRLKV